MKRTIFAGMVLTAFLCAPLPARAENIFEALSQTYRTNPTLQAQRAYLRSVDENVAIAKSGFRPNIALTAGYTDVNASGDTGSSVPGAYYQSGRGDSTQKIMAAKLSQPVFNGFSTLNSVRSADSYVRAEQNVYYSVEQDIFLEASTAYLDVVRDLAIVRLQKNNEKLLKKRLEETIQRFNVGEVTRTDVSQARARYSQAKSDRIAAEGNLEVSKAVYRRVIGNEPKDLEDPEQIRNFLPQSLDQALNIALLRNYSIQAARHTLKAKDYDINTNTGALLPQVSLDGLVSQTKNEYDTAGAGDIESDNVEWSVNMTVPLYNSGETRARIRQAKYQKWQAQEQVLEAERAVDALVKSAWEYMMANESQIGAIRDQVRANEIALDGVQKEEALGNRTILDVLDAYQELLNSNVNEVKARRDYYVSAINLLLSMGKLTAADLKLAVEIYNPKKFYKETRDKWFSLN